MQVHGSYRPRLLRELFALLIVYLLTVLISPTPIVAQSNRVIGNGSASSCTEEAFTSALPGGGSISFNCGASPLTIKLNTGKKITVATTIDGGNKITLDAQNKVRHFYVNADYKAAGVLFTMKNISLINGKSSGNDSGAGGCLYNRQSIVDVERVSFSGCNASQGGAVYNYKGTLTITGSSFMGNRAETDGGGVAAPGNSGAVNIYSSTFKDNKAGLNGGGVFIIGGSLKVADSLFEANEALAQVQLSGIGGGIYTDKDPTSVTVTRTRFVNNKAYEGGGMFADRGTTLTLSDSEFVGNISTKRSGGFGAYEAKVYVSNSSFRDNKSFEGGGIYVGSPQSISEFRNITVVNNQAGGDGGGFYHRQGVMLLSNSLISNNAAGQDLLGDKRGGGIVIYDGTNTIVSTTIANNRIEGAGAYGGGIASNGTTEVINTTIYNNRAGRGGGVYINRHSTRVVNSTFVNNSALTGHTVARGSNGTIAFKNSILVSPVGGTSLNCVFSRANFVDEGNNLQFGDTTCFPNKPSVDLKLATLGSNGGPTPTIPLNAGSPAIDAADSKACPTTDQRGFSRAGVCDIGAFEVTSESPPPPANNLPPRIWLPLIRD